MLMWDSRLAVRWAKTRGPIQNGKIPHAIQIGTTHQPVN
jgi:hypothetical protein